MFECARHGDYRIAIYSTPHDPTALSKLFEQELRLPSGSAIVWNHHIPGILNEEFSEDKAKKLAASLRLAGVRASAVRRDEIPNLHLAVIVHHLKCTEEGIQLFEPSGHPSALIPWAAVQMVCVGEVFPNISRRHPPSLATGPATGHHYQRPAVDVPFTPIIEAWITCGPPYPHLRFEQDRMHFDGLDSQRREQVPTAFRNLIQDVIARTPTAFVSDSTRAFLQHSQQNKYHFKHPEALLQYATLQALLAREPAVEGSSEAAT